MYSSDAEFFSKYKKMDNMVKDMYGPGGISRYIELLEQNRSNYIISKNWEFYRQLKHLRWVRNQIAHSDEKDSFATAEDMENLDAIYEAFLNRNDPMYLMKAEEEKKLHRVGPYGYTSEYYQGSSVKNGKNNLLALAIIFLFLIISFWALLSLSS